MAQTNKPNKLETLYSINRDVVGENNKGLHLQDVLAAINGLWLSFSVSDKNSRHLIDHVYYSTTDAEKRKEDIIAKWVLSKSFFDYKFEEPMNLVLFSGATRKNIIVVSRDCNIKIMQREDNNIVDLGKFAEINQEDTKEIDVEINNLVQKVLEKVDKNTDDKVIEEIYKEISETIRNLVDKYLNKIKIKFDVVEQLWNQLHQDKLKEKQLKRISKILVEACIWNRLTDDYKRNKFWQKIYYIPDTLSDKGYSSGFVCATTEETNEKEDLDFLSLICNRICGVYYYISHLHDIRIASTKSAIGSIMSRNGSHNIGSHVLAELSHNVGTMPDDQVLYQYIQHRMDFIATATTERPTWNQPTMFVGEVMKRFLSQRHLLNYISRSEGLKAWEFQSDKARMEGPGGKIKFHIRKVSKILDATNKFGKLVDNLSVDHSFIDYRNLETAINLAKDVSLAIPGGVVGQHAFFTIIENIIRNAAKHDWSTPPKLTQCLKCSDSNPKGCMDVYIDYEDTPGDLNIHFVIWTRITDVFNNDQKANIPSDCSNLSDEDVDNALKENSLKGLPLHKRQQIELARPFIDADGSLRRENWGLAEMKISAGYLQKADIEAIGGINKKGRDIIVPCAVPDTWAETEDEDNGLNPADLKELKKVYHLGYRFDVPKSKLILFLVDSISKEILSDELEAQLNRNGIYIKLIENVRNNLELSYQYVVMDEFCGETLRWMLPFRIIATLRRDDAVKDKVPLLFDEAKDKSSVYEYLENVKNESEDDPHKISTYLRYVIEESEGDPDKISMTLIESICACWVRHLVSKRGFDKSGISLRVSTKVSTQDTSSGKSLATPEDIVEFAFNEGLDKALKTYEVACKEIADFPVNKKIIDALRDLKGELIYTRQDNSNGKDSGKEQSNLGYDFYIKRQLGDWLEKWLDLPNCSDNDIQKAVNFLRGETLNIQELEKLVNEELEKLNDLNEDTPEYIEQRDKWSALDDKLQIAKNSLTSPIANLVSYLESYCIQIQNFLSKYAEKIATLPKGFSIGKSKSDFNCDWQDANIFSWDSKANRKVLRYWRHETTKNKEYDVYLEGLSGTQSYLSTLEKIGNNDYPLIARLAENALIRILIIDERVSEFLEKHNTMLSRFNNMGIFVVNDKKVDAELELIDKEENEKVDEEGNGKVDTEVNLKDESEENFDICDVTTNSFVNLSANVINNIRNNFKIYKNPKAALRKTLKRSQELLHDQFDAIIIHQGIIDKWITGASQDKKKVAAFIGILKSVFSYVVITTGRGTPANIPNSARVLPFSTIQTTLFKQYPEKMILTDAIMNILPVKPEKGEPNG